MQHHQHSVMSLQDADRLQQMGQDRSSLQRQVRQVQERITLASSQQQVEEAASSLTTLENLLQVCGTASLAVHTSLADTLLQLLAHSRRDSLCWRSSRKRTTASCGDWCQTHVA